MLFDVFLKAWFWRWGGITSRKTLCVEVWRLIFFSKFPYVWAPYCVGRLWTFQISLCVNTVLVWIFYCGEEIGYFQKDLPVLGNFPLWWRDWLFLKKSLCWGLSPVVERLIIFEKNPCARDFPLYWRDWFFSGENPCAGAFLAPISPKKSCF